MKKYMRHLRRKMKDHRGITLLEVVISTAILGIIIGIVTINVMRLVQQAYMTRANDTAKVVYMALQTALTDAKGRGEFEEIFSKDDAHRGKDTYRTIPDIAIDGKTIGGIRVPGVDLGLPATATQAEKDAAIADLNKLKADKDLVYMTLSSDKTDTDSKIFKDLIDPYLMDKGIMEYTLLAEVNLNNKTVRSVFYTERAEKFAYFEGTEGTLDKTALEAKWNVLLRTKESLDDKRQGYYGTLGTGVKESVRELDNAYVKVDNTDMLTVEWGEIGPVGNGVITPEKRKIFAETTYDVSIVNVNDASKVYYKIEDISAYKRGESYLEPVEIGKESPKK
ncbi:MAG: type II secretion system protein, partial [Lachnospiraceae bacterium]